MQALPPHTPSPSSLAAQLVRVHDRVDAALTEQLVLLRLSDDPALSRAVIRRLPRAVARDVSDDVAAHRELARLTPAQPLSAFHVGPAAPAPRLLAWYREAQRRSGIAWQTLAAINYVESDFGRLREASVAGAQGPMQFMPSTWAAYGRGNVHDPHQAILAAARFLRAAGGRLYRYNPSWAYVDAVGRYAGRIRRDPRAFLVYYARRLIVRTPGGYRRLD
jgi:soluble lytic murein transglycosylase-like protein